VMVEAATLRSGYDLKDSTGFADRIESMLRRAMGVSMDEKVEEEPADDDAGVKLDVPKNDDDENVIDDDADSNPSKSTKVCSKKDLWNAGNEPFPLLGCRSRSCRSLKLN
jgi:hypothetical protein